MSRVALFLSPHLDDVAFSCGGTVARLAAGGWRCVVVTAFTATVPHPRGFALACQTTKGVPAAADYMAVRRAEDAAACLNLGAEPIWLPFAEAPHRGYESAAALFAGVRPDDGVVGPLAAALAETVARLRPDRVFAPQGLGNHADHLQLIRAVPPAVAPRAWWYRDTPYAIRQATARPSDLLPPALAERACGVGDGLAAKLDACACYATQLPFQFGGEAAMRGTLATFAASQGGERFLAPPDDTGRL